jgi:hypothetical protein
MRKILSLLLVPMLMISISSLTFAEEAGDHPDNDQNPHDNSGNDNETGSSDDNNENETEDDVNETDDDVFENETEDEIQIMNASLGAEIRLLQLEKAIIKNILKGEMTIAVLKSLEFNTTELESLLADLKAVLEDVRAINASANDSVARFVALKQEARNATKLFKESLHALLDDVTLREIRERVQELAGDELQNYTRRIQNRIRQFNSNQMYRLFGIIGEANMSLLHDYLNGNITLDQLRFQLSKTMNQMNHERQHEMFSELKEERIRNKIHAKESMDDLKHHGNGNGQGESP